MPKDDLNDQQTDDTEEQSDKDQADVEESGVEESDDEDTTEEGDGEESAEGDADADAEESGEDDDDDDSTEVLSQAKFDALKNDPAKLLKELNRAATKKFQKIATARRVLEPYADFITAYEDDPKAAVAELAETLGIEVKAPKSEAKAEEAIESLSDQIKARVKTALGAEYEDLADKLGVAIHDAAALMVKEAIKPLREDQDSLVRNASAQEARTTVTAFTKKHPDWKKYDKKMTALSRQLPPSKGMDPLEYMENIYYLASRDAERGNGVKKAVKRMAESAKRASENGSRTVSDKVVAKDPGRNISFKEAAAMAERGERLE